MKTIRGGKTAKEGFYLNLNNKEIVTLEKEGPLPGPETVRYLRIPMIVMLVGGPFVGLLYVIFLPFISFAMLLTVGFQKVRKALASPHRKAIPLRTVAVSELKNVPQVKVVPEVKVDTPKKDLLIPLEYEISKQRKEGFQ